MGTGAQRADHRTMRARAHEAVTRLRLRRATGWHHLLVSLAGLSAFFAPAAAVVGATAIAVRVGGFDADKSYVLLGLVMAGILVLFATALMMFLIILVPYLLYAAAMEFVWLKVPAMVGLAALAAWIVVRAVPRHLRWLALRRQAEAILIQRGELGAGWVADDLHRSVRDRLAFEDDDLRVTEDGGLAPKLDLAPPESCPCCGAPLSIPGVGLRRCEYCGFERYDDLPDPGMALRSAREVFLAAQAQEAAEAAGGDSPRVLEQGDATAPPGSLLPVRRRELWKIMARTLGKKTRRQGRRILVYLGLVIVFGLLVDALRVFTGDDRVDSSVLGMILFSFGILAALACAFELPWFSASYITLRFGEFRRGARAYDLALLGEIVRAVAYKGRATKEEIAAHLGIRRRDLDALLLEVSRYGGAPFYHDRVHDQLIGLQAFHAGSNRCLACGGTLEVEKRGRMRCAHCGSEALGLMPAP